MIPRQILLILIQVPGERQLIFIFNLVTILSPQEMMLEILRYLKQGLLDINCLKVRKIILL